MIIKCLTKFIKQDQKGNVTNNIERRTPSRQQFKHFNYVCRGKLFAKISFGLVSSEIGLQTIK